MPHEGHLKQAFAAGSSGKRADNTEFPCPPGIPLTAGEEALVQSIFGDEVKTKRVRKYLSPTEKPGTKKGWVIPAQTFGKYSLKFYGPQYQSADYSQSDIFNFGTFIHEMTHIWQNQNNVPFNPVPKDCDHYKYKLTSQSVFGNFSWEQQARIIEDYARQNLFPDRPPDVQPDPLLQKVVEDRFPQALKTRLGLRTAPKAAPTIRPPKIA